MDSMKIIKNMVKVYTPIKMVTLIQDGGPLVKSMETALILIRRQELE